MYKSLILCIFTILIIPLIALILLRKNYSIRQLFIGTLISVILSALPVKFVMTTTFFTDEVTITAKTNSERKNVLLTNILANDWSNTIPTPIKGQWVWSDNAYLWNTDISNEMSNLTKSITFNIPVGTNRKLVFKSGKEQGSVVVYYNSNKEKYSLYTETDSTKEIKLPDSDRIVSIKDKLFRPFLLALFECVLLSTVFLTIKILSKTHIIEYILTCKYELFTFSMCLIQIIRLGWFPKNYNYPTSYYFMNYEDGFGARKILGSTLYALAGPYIDNTVLAKIKLFLLIIFYFTSSIMIVRFVKKLSCKYLGVFFVLLYLYLPSTFIQITDNLRIDFFLIILFLIAIYFININKGILFIPIICILLMLNNESSCTFFIAPIVMLLFFEWFYHKDIKYLLSTISSSIFTCILGIYFLVNGKRGAMTPQEAYYHNILHTNANISARAFSAEDLSITDHLYDNKMYLGSQIYDKYNFLCQSIVYFIMLIPVVILFIILWKALYCKIKQNLMLRYVNLAVYKFLFTLIILSNISGISCMLLGVDYVRFSCFCMISSISVIITLINIEHVNISIYDLRLFEETNDQIPIYPLLVIIYLTFWGEVGVWTPNTPIVYKTVDFFNSLKG